MTIVPVSCWAPFKTEWNVIAEDRVLFSDGEQVGFHWITNVFGNVAGRQSQSFCC